MLNNLKYAFHGIVKNITYTLIALLQFTFSFTFLYFIIQENIYINNEVNRITSILDERHIYGIKVPDDSIILRDKSLLKNSLTFQDYLNSKYKIQHVTYSSDFINIQNFNGINNFSQPGPPNNKYSWVRCIEISNNFMDNFKFEIDLGRNFNKRDFNKDLGETIPIVVGANYKKFLNINEEINYISKYGNNEDVRKLKVIGFLKPNYYFFTNGNEDFMNINLDSIILFPIQSLDKTIGTDPTLPKNNMSEVLQLKNIRDSLILIDTKDNNEKNIIFNEVQKELTNLKLNNHMSLVDLRNKSNNLISNFKSSIKEHSTIVYFAILFSSIGIICTTLNNIKHRYIEFGVHISYGANIKSIAIRIYLEIFLIHFTALVLSTIFASIINLYLKGIAIDIMSLFKLTILVLMLSIIIAAYPIFKIFKSKSAYLLRG